MSLSCLRLVLIPLFLIIASCGGSNEPVPKSSTSTRQLAVSFDSASRSLFFTGTTSTSGNFESELPFSLWFSLAADPNSAQNEASRFLLDNHGPHITQRASFNRSKNKEGQIALLGGRLILRGKSRRHGEELEGTWYFDGLPGGTFWIRP